MNDSQSLQDARVDIAKLQVQVDHLTVTVEDLKESNKEQTVKLDQVLLALSEAKGGWRTLMLVGGAASSIGAGVAWVGSHWRA